jgi:hypothetical protein
MKIIYNKGLLTVIYLNKFVLWNNLWDRLNITHKDIWNYYTSCKLISVVIFGTVIYWHITWVKLHTYLLAMRTIASLLSPETPTISPINICFPCYKNQMKYSSQSSGWFVYDFFSITTFSKNMIMSSLNWCLSWKDIYQSVDLQSDSFLNYMYKMYMQCTLTR